MPKANWGVSSSDVDNFDRNSQYQPYDGLIPPNGVYEWNIKVLKFAAATKEKLPQLRVGLELSPREGRDEDKYEGYFKMAFLNVSDKTAFVYVPFLDAIGVTGREFTERTITDEEGNVKKIGRWRNTGEEYIRAELTTNEYDTKDGKGIGWIGPINDDDDGEDLDDDDDYDD